MTRYSFLVFGAFTALLLVYVNLLLVLAMICERLEEAYSSGKGIIHPESLRVLYSSSMRDDKA